jgi:glycosyltransferase involved in cell wall biosynthesis
MKVINVGVYPPPYGGVSIHLKRLLEYLQSKRHKCLLIDLSPYQKNQSDVVNFSWRKAIWFLLFVAPNCIVHFHNFSLKNTLIFFLASFRHKTILSFHNERFLDELYSVGRLWRLLISIFLSRLDFLVVDTPRSKELIKKVVEDRTRILVIPEFIPPSFVPPLENEAIKIVRRTFKYLLASNAFQIVIYRNQDLYGLDLLVEMIQRLVFVHNVDVAMVFLLPSIGNIEYFETITRRIRSLGLTERFIIVTEPIEEAVSLWKISDVVIRATNTDGNSLTIMEALSIQVPVVASDCCERPEGAVLFQTRNVDDLCDKVMAVLSNSELNHAHLKNVHREDNAAALLKLYEELGSVGGNIYEPTR